MANSFVRYTGNGSTTQYAVSFTYRDQADVTVTINGVATTAFTYNASGTQITFTTAPANGSAIEIRRRTSQSSRLVDYAAGSVLTENDLDTDSNQAFFMGQEAIDDAGDVIKLDAANFQWDVQSKRLTNVADPVNNNDAVNKAFLSTNLGNITTVAGISANVTTVAGISANVTTVANANANIATVATNIANVNTVATDIAKVIVVANDLNETVSEIETAAADLQETTSEIDTVANAITNVDLVGNNIANVNTVAGISANVTTVANNNANINTLAAITNLGTLASNATNINTVATDIANVNTVAGNNTNINTVAANNTNITTVANANSNITTLAPISANITTVAGISSDVTSVANNNTNVSTVAGAITNVNNVGGSIANVNSVASNLAGVNSFAERYRIQAGVPSSSNDVGDLVFDTTAQKLKVFDGSSYQLAGSSVNGTSQRFKFTATSNQTTFSGNDDDGNSLTYDPLFLDVYLNGVRLVNGSSNDYVATNGTSIVLNSGAGASDILNVVSFGTFSLASFSATAITSDTLASARLPVVPIDKGGTGLTSVSGQADKVLKVNSSSNAFILGQASSPEVYGFIKSFTPTTIIYTVTVQSVGGSNKYFINGVQQDTLELLEGNTYIFNHPSAHPFRFSTDSGNTSAYTTGVTVVSSTQVRIVVGSSAPTLYYYCSSHSAMGGQANTPIPANNTLQVITTNQGADNITNTQYNTFDDVLFSASGYTFSIDGTTGNLIATI